MNQAIKLFLLLTFVTSISVGQNSPEVTEYKVVKTNVGKKRKLRFQKFKETKTIFTFSSVIERDVYEKILKECWTVTPYEIIPIDKFNLEDYRSDKYSFGRITGYVKDKTTKMSNMVSSISVSFSFDYFEKRKKNNFRMVYATSFALYPNDQFVNKALKSVDNASEGMNKENVFYNYSPGLLKNYLQYINKRIETEQDFLREEELGRMVNKTLYLPSYLQVRVDAFSGKENKDIDNVNSVFENYNYPYEFIDNKELSDKIMNGEDFYYLRYIRLNANQVYAIVNSKTGNVIYNVGHSGLSYNIKSKHLKELNHAIKKASK